METVKKNEVNIELRFCRTLPGSGPVKIQPVSVCLCGAPSHLGTPVGTKGWFRQASVVGTATNGGTFLIFHIICTSYIFWTLCLNPRCIKSRPFCSISPHPRTRFKGQFRKLKQIVWARASEFTFLITSAGLNPPEEPDTCKLLPCVHMHVIYFM